MEILVNRVFRNSVQDHEDVIKKKWLYLNDIDSIEESVEHEGYTTIYIGSQDILVNEDIKELYKRFKTIKEELIDEARNRELLG
jgi:hypothetical protein